MALELVIYGARQFGIKSIFLDEVASSKLELHGGFFRKYGHLGFKRKIRTRLDLLSIPRLGGKKLR